MPGHVRLDIMIIEPQAANAPHVRTQMRYSLLGGTFCGSQTVFDTGLDADDVWRRGFVIDIDRSHEAPLAFGVQFLDPGAPLAEFGAGAVSGPTPIKPDHLHSPYP